MKSWVLLQQSSLCLWLCSFLFYIFRYLPLLYFYIQRCVDRNFLGFSIPTVFFLSLNPIFILVLSPLYALLYKTLGKRNRDLSITIKFPLGIFISSLCFFSLYLSTFFILSDNKISFLWIILVFFMISAGELFTSALGVAMITKIAPSRLYGVMMGAWYLIACALAADLSGSLASLASIPLNLINNTQAMFHIYASGFLKMGLLGLAVAIVGFIISPWLKKMISSES